MKSLVSSLALALGIAIGSSASAAPLSVFESSAPGGDFAGGSSAANFNVGTLGVGANPIFGGLAGTCVPFDCNGASAGDTQDSFNFTVAAGTELVRISAGTQGGGPRGLTISFSLAKVVPVRDSLGFVTLPVNQTGNAFSGVLGAGTYNLSAYGQSALDQGDFDVSWATELSVRPTDTTTPIIPLPAGAVLLLSAVGGLAVARRRSRNA